MSLRVKLLLGELKVKVTDALSLKADGNKVKVTCFTI